MPPLATSLHILLEEAARCAKCGACTAVCPIYRLTGRESLASRGRLHLLAKLSGSEPTSDVFAEIFSQCLLCGACADTCPRGIDMPDLLIRARHAMRLEGGEESGLRRAIRSVLASPLLLGGAAAAARAVPASLINMIPLSSGLRLRLAGLRAAFSAGSAISTAAINDNQEKSGTPTALLFAGCYALHLEPSIIDFTRLLIRKTYKGGLCLPEAQNCCGLAAASAGDQESARKLAQKNIAAFKGTHIPILVSCASCFSHLSTYPNFFANDAGMREEAVSFVGRLREFSTFLDMAPYRIFTDTGRGASERRVLYHDPCHLRFRHRITAPARRLLTNAPATVLHEMPGGPRCCGQGGLFHIAHPGLTSGLRQEYQEYCQATEIDVITTTCTGCLLGLRESFAGKNDSPVIMHLASYLQIANLPSMP